MTIIGIAFGRCFRLGVSWSRVGGCTGWMRRYLLRMGVRRTELRWVVTLRRLQLVFLCLCLGTPAASCGEVFAVIVGVGEYDHLDKGFQLFGPENDVAAMAQSLRHRGVLSRNIVRLSDRWSDRSPTLGNIHSAIVRTIARVKRGDLVVLYFAGHGSLQPDLSGDEEDGFDEIFLPKDVRSWNGGRGSVEGALVDDDIAGYVAAFERKGVRIWLIFDSCFSGTMSKAGFSERVRYINPFRALSIPGTNRRAVFTERKRISASNAGLLVNVEGGSAAFFASNANEATLELLIDGEFRGLFTHALTRALDSREKVTFGHLAKAVRERYEEQDRSSPRPQFQGSLHSKIFY